MITKGMIVMIIVNRIRCDVATCDKLAFSFSAKIINGPNAPGAAENIDAFFHNQNTFEDILKQLKYKQ